MNGMIIEHTNRVAAQLLIEFAHDPGGEVEAWVRTAQQREAMVVALYEGGAVRARLPELANEPKLAAVVRLAVGGIWAQERGHTALIQGLRIVDDASLAQRETAMGRIEGNLTHWATTQGAFTPIAKFLIMLGRAAGKAPDFTKLLSPLSLVEFFRFSQELETTAAHGYQRILELLRELRSIGSGMRFGGNSEWDFVRILAEERFHAAVFECLCTWVRADGTFIDKNDRDAAEELNHLHQRHLYLAMIEELQPLLRASPDAKPEYGDEPLSISDGGLGDLFAAYGFEIQVADSRG